MILTALIMSSAYASIEAQDTGGYKREYYDTDEN